MERAETSDTWDIFNAAKNIWGDQLKEDVLKMKATLVVRPDSGDPVTVVSELLDILDARFGSIINTKKYKVLNKVRIIQGDGINADVLEKILAMAKEKHFSTTNLAFGMGGGLLQKDFDRDTLKFAFKCCWARVNGKDIEVYKDPITDPGKKSKRGLLDLKLIPGRGVVTVANQGHADSLMETVYMNGEITKTYTFNEVRANAAAGPYIQG